MKQSIPFLIGSVCSISLAYGQQQDTLRAPAWEFSAEANFYFFSDDFLFLPVFKADKNHLHLEARYNYEDEYLFDFETSDNNYFYSWTDLSYSPADWLWFGISGQRTRVYDSDLEIERGLLIGGGYKIWELTGYLYNIGSDDVFVLLSLSASF